MGFAQVAGTALMLDSNPADMIERHVVLDSATQLNRRNFWVGTRFEEIGARIA